PAVGAGRVGSDCHAEAPTAADAGYPTIAARNAGTMTRPRTRSPEPTGTRMRQHPFFDGERQPRYEPIIRRGMSRGTPPRFPRIAGWLPERRTVRASAYSMLLSRKKVIRRTIFRASQKTFTAIPFLTLRRPSSRLGLGALFGKRFPIGVIRRPCSVRGDHGEYPRCGAARGSLDRDRLARSQCHGDR